MLAYAASRPAPIERRSYPNALLVIIALHVAGLAAVMSAKMEFQRIIPESPIDIFTVPPPEPPPTPVEPVRTKNPTQPTKTEFTRPEREVDIALPPDPSTASGGTVSQGPPQGKIALNIPTYHPPVRDIVKRGPTLLTSGEDLKPPYPASKLLTEEEASLTLRLTIDERGRVVAVAPVGRTDRVFLEAARRHLIGHWRYRPATVDGRPIASSTVVTLRFQLDG